MAYADANSSNRKFGAGAAVIALEAGLAWAIITGLAVTMNRKIDPRIDTFKVPPETKVKPPEPTATPTARPDPYTPRPVDQPIVDLGPFALPTFTPLDTGSGDGGGIEIPHTVPTPPPVPTFTPKPARPKGNYAGWVTTNDYPLAGIRLEHEGTVRYRQSRDAAGKPTGCTVAASSGHAELDEATCATLRRRAKFEPASDDSGARVAGSYSGTVTWRLPQD